MQHRIGGAVAGGVRVALLVGALVVALLPIARAATTGFCPPTGDDEGAAATAVAAPVGVLLAAVEPTTTEGTGTGGEAPADDGADATDGAGDTSGSTDGEEAVVDVGPCGEGVEECLPPLLSAVLEFGEPTCGGAAVARLRSSMVPAFLLSAGLLVGAWLLRPRDGAPVLSRW